MKIWFDMDGTIANLYGVENWLEMLHNEDATPYIQAMPLLNLNVLARYLNKLIENGIEIGVISWLAKNASDEYNEAITIAKLNWLNKHLRSVKFSEIHIVKYGTPKESFATIEDILFDDEVNNRDNWIGTAYDEKNIIAILKSLI